MDENAYVYKGFLIIDTNKKGDNRFECYERNFKRGWDRFDSAPTLVLAQVFCKTNKENQEKKWRVTK